MKRILSLFLSMLLIISVVPLAIASAEETATTEFIEVRTIEDLYNINNNMSGNYKLMNDIDMTEATAEGGDWDYMGNGWDPIGSSGVYGSSTPFTGTFDGNGYSIIGMRIDVTKIPNGVEGELKLGLFSSIKGGSLSNLKIKNSEFMCVTNKFIDIIFGAFCGYLGENASINNCSNDSSMTVENVYDSNTIKINAAGIAGYVSSGTIEKSYNLGKISANGKSEVVVSGIAGYVSSGTIIDCYNTGDISSRGHTNRIIDATSISKGGSTKNCYNTGILSTSRYVSPIGGTATNCYYLDTTTASTQTGAKALTEAQMKLQSMYSGFDFENTWIIDSSTSYKYPQLRSNRQDTLKEIDIVELATTPTKTTYFTGDKLNVDGGKLLVYYMDGTSEYIDITEDMVSGYDMETTGYQNATVTFREKTVSYQINVVQRPNLMSLTLTNEPEKTEFVRGTSFDFTGCQAVAKYDNNMTETIDITPDMVTGIDINTSGEQTATFEYFGQSVSFKITVIPVRVTSIEILSLPTKTTYIEGQTPNYAGLKVKAIYNNGTEKEVTDYTIGDVDTSVGIRPVTVSYGVITTTFNVKFIAKTATSLSITKTPDKTTYVQGQKFDKTGMIVEALFDNGTTEEVANYTIGNMPEELGYQTVEVLYQGVKAYVTVYIVEKDIESIAIKTLPSKIEYIEGEDFDKTGLEVIAVYNDGTESAITDYTLTGASTAKVGTTSVTVNYKNYTAKFNINIVEKTLIKIEIEKPDKTSYIYGEDFDESGLKVFAFYDNGKSQEVNDFEVTGFTGESGKNTITVTYQGETKQFNVTVHTPKSQWTIITNATCIKDGSKVIECADCGTILKTESIDALDHDWAENEILKKPTCTKEGTRIYYCSRCDETKETAIKALDHDFSDEWTIDKKASCSQTGLKSHHCSRCSAVSDETVIEKDPHTTKWVTDKQPTCTSLGHKYQICTVCDETLETSDIPMTEHNYNSRVFNPTCTEQGYTLFVCSDCGASKKGNYTFELGHTPSEWRIEKDSTCSELGLQVKICETCDEVISSKQIELKPHTEVVDNAIVPTCTETGLTEGKHCATCDEVLVAQNKVDALGHKVKTVGKKSATYFAKGYTGDKKCSVCGKVITKGKAIAQLKLETPKFSLKGATKKFTVKYTKVSGATGFQVRYKTGKGKYKTVNFDTKKSASKVIKKLKKGKYTVQIRAYIKSGSKKAYSSWAKAKTVKVK